MKTTPQTVPMTELARLTGLTARRLQQLAQDGVFAADESGRYDLAGALQAILRHYGRQSTSADMKQERLLKTKAERELAELELRERRGELVDRFILRQDLAPIYVEMVRLVRISGMTETEQDALLAAMARLHPEPPTANDHATTPPKTDS